MDNVSTPRCILRQGKDESGFEEKAYLSFWLVQNLFQDGFPTSGNDREEDRKDGISFGAPLKISAKRREAGGLKANSCLRHSYNSAEFELAFRRPTRAERIESFRGALLLVPFSWASKKMNRGMGQSPTNVVPSNPAVKGLYFWRCGVVKLGEEKGEVMALVFF